MGLFAGFGGQIYHFAGRREACVENDMDVAGGLMAEEVDALSHVARAARPARDRKLRVVDEERRSFYGRRTPPSQDPQRPDAPPRSQGTPGGPEELRLIWARRG